MAYSPPMRDGANSASENPSQNKQEIDDPQDSDDISTALAAAAAQVASELDGWSDELRFDANTQARRREHWLKRQASEDATLAGALLDYSERKSLLSIETLTGSEYVGVLQGAGSSLVAMQTNAHQVFINLNSIFSVNLLRDRHTHAIPVGHRMSLIHTVLADVLRQASADRPEVVVRSWAGNSIEGTLRAVGRDVVELRRDTGSSSYVPLPSISEVLLPLSTRSG